MTQHPERPRRDWSARTRGTVQAALRYTKFVGVMKRALPIMALALVAAVAVYSFLPRQVDRVSFTFERMGKIADDLAMIKPRLSGTDSAGNPFVITADSAVQPDKNSARLNKVQADINMPDSQWLSASAGEGIYDLNRQTLELTGGMSIFSGNGYELHSAAGHVDMKSGLFTGPTPVTGQGPLGSLRADRFTVDRQTRQVRLSGNVHMVLYPQARK
jgi:lipopolysaccharide export system protein LptC